MMDLCFDRDRIYIAEEFQEHDWIKDSGKPISILADECYQILANSSQSIGRRRALIMAHLLDFAQIEVRPFDCFADQMNHGAIPYDMLWNTYREKQQTIHNQLDETLSAVKCCAFTGDEDFGHTCPDWQAILSLGLSGLINRLQKAANSSSPQHAEFYENGVIVYQALIRYLGRLAKAAEKHAEVTSYASSLADCLRALQIGPPQTLYQALELTYIYYTAQTELEQANVRTLGRFDSLIGPFYEHDIAEGICTKEQAKELLKYYLYRWNARNVTANIPIMLCGKDSNGNKTDPAFSSLLVETYGELDIISPKFHISYTPDTDRGLLRQVLALIREGKNSFVFCNDSQVESALQKLGLCEEDTRNYVMVGCYESTAAGKEVACSCNGRISFPKAVEYALSGGVDLLSRQQIGSSCSADYVSFDELVSAVKQQLIFFADQCMHRICLCESLYPIAFSAPFFSGTMQDCVEKGIDAYAGGAKYNNSSINCFGIATAADALAAVKQLVFKEKRLSLSAFTSVLSSNWENNEKLRLTCQKHMPKYGVGNTDVDALAADLVSTVTKHINGKPNGRGGVFRAGAFSIDWRIEFGGHTAASADGRFAGEPLSKNLCASLGQDTQGVTALIQSATRFDASLIPNGAVLDITLHESAVRGTEGLEVMLGLLSTFMKAGGMAIQMNVLDANTLRKAQIHPEQYTTLQVRLCGWNVLFVNLSKLEQDELIVEAQNA